MCTEQKPDLGRLIGYCNHLSKRCNDGYLRRAGYDVTPVQTHALSYLAYRGQEIHQRELEREMRLKPSTVNGIVSRLEEKGYITRRISPHDGRCRLVSLTDAGRDKVTEFQTVIEKTEHLLVRGFSPEELVQLRTLLFHSIANLENEVNSV